MKWNNMVVLEINLDKCFPVVVAIVHFNMVKHVAIKFKIIGNTKFKEKAIQDSLELKTPRWNSWYKQNDRYSRESLQGDLEKLKSWYQDRGYANFQMESVQVQISPDKEDMFINLNVSEGEVYRIADAKLAGNTIIPVEQMQAFLLVRPGQVYSQRLIAATQELIQNRLGEEGFAFAKVDPVPKLDDDKKEVSIDGCPSDWNVTLPDVVTVENSNRPAEGIDWYSVLPDGLRKNLPNFS